MKKLLLAALFLPGVSLPVAAQVVQVVDVDPTIGFGCGGKNPSILYNEVNKNLFVCDRTNGWQAFTSGAVNSPLIAGPFTLTLNQLENANNIPIPLLAAPGAGKVIVIGEQSINPVCATCVAPTFYDGPDGMGNDYSIITYGNSTAIISTVAQTCSLQDQILANPLEEPTAVCIFPPNGSYAGLNGWAGAINQPVVFSWRAGNSGGGPAQGRPLSSTVGTPGTGYTNGDLVATNCGIDFPSCYFTVTASGGIVSALTPVFPPSGYTNLTYVLEVAPGQTNLATTSQPSAMTVGTPCTGCVDGDTGFIGAAAECMTTGAYQIVGTTPTVIFQPTGCTAGIVTTAPDGPQPGSGTGLTFTAVSATDSGTLTINIDTVQIASGGSGYTATVYFKYFVISAQ